MCDIKENNEPSKTSRPGTNEGLSMTEKFDKCGPKQIKGNKLMSGSDAFIIQVEPKPVPVKRKISFDGTQQFSKLVENKACIIQVDNNTIIQKSAPMNQTTETLKEATSSKEAETVCVARQNLTAKLTELITKVQTRVEKPKVSSEDDPHQAIDDQTSQSEDAEDLSDVEDCSDSSDSESGSDDGTQVKRPRIISILRREAFPKKAKQGPVTPANIHVPSLSHQAVDTGESKDHSESIPNKNELSQAKRNKDAAKSDILEGQNKIDQTKVDKVSNECKTTTEKSLGTANMDPNLVKHENIQKRDIVIVGQTNTQSDLSQNKHIRPQMDTLSDNKAENAVDQVHPKDARETDSAKFNSSQPKPVEATNISATGQVRENTKDLKVRDVTKNIDVAVHKIILPDALGKEDCSIVDTASETNAPIISSSPKITQRDHLNDDIIMLDETSHTIHLEPYITASSNHRVSSAKSSFNDAHSKKMTKKQSNENKKKCAAERESLAMAEQHKALQQFEKPGPASKKKRSAFVAEELDKYLSRGNAAQKETCDLIESEPRRKIPENKESDKTDQFEVDGFILHMFGSKQKLTEQVLAAKASKLASSKNDTVYNEPPHIYGWRKKMNSDISVPVTTGAGIRHKWTGSRKLVRALKPLSIFKLGFQLIEQETESTHAPSDVTINDLLLKYDHMKVKSHRIEPGKILKADCVEAALECLGKSYGITPSQKNPLSGFYLLKDNPLGDMPGCQVPGVLKEEADVEVKKEPQDTMSDVASQASQTPSQDSHVDIDAYSMSQTSDVQYDYDDADVDDNSDFPLPEVLNAQAWCGRDCCRLGCVCSSLQRSSHRAILLKKHCGQASCIFGCRCKEWRRRIEGGPKAIWDGTVVDDDGRFLDSDGKLRSSRASRPSKAALAAIETQEYFDNLFKRKKPTSRSNTPTNGVAYGQDLSSNSSIDKGSTMVGKSKSPITTSQVVVVKPNTSRSSTPSPTSTSLVVTIKPETSRSSTPSPITTSQVVTIKPDTSRSSTPSLSQKDVDVGSEEAPDLGEAFDPSKVVIKTEVDEDIAILDYDNDADNASDMPVLKREPTESNEEEDEELAQLSRKLLRRRESQERRGANEDEDDRAQRMRLIMKKNYTKAKSLEVVDHMGKRHQKLVHSLGKRVEYEEDLDTRRGEEQDEEIHNLDIRKLLDDEDDDTMTCARTTVYVPVRLRQHNTNTAPRYLIKEQASNPDATKTTDRPTVIVTVAPVASQKATAVEGKPNEPKEIETKQASAETSLPPPTKDCSKITDTPAALQPDPPAEKSIQNANSAQNEPTKSSSETSQKSALRPTSSPDKNKKKFLVQMILLQRKTVYEGNDNIPHLLEIHSNCKWDQIRVQLLSKVSQLADAGEYPTPTVLHVGQFTATILPRHSKPTKIPGHLRATLKSQFVFSIRLRITRAESNTSEGATSANTDSEEKQTTSTNQKSSGNKQDQSKEKEAKADSSDDDLVILKEEKGKRVTTSADKLKAASVSASFSLSGLNALKLNTPGLMHIPEGGLRVGDIAGNRNKHQGLVMPNTKPKSAITTTSAVGQKRPATTPTPPLAHQAKKLKDSTAVGSVPIPASIGNMLPINQGGKLKYIVLGNGQKAVGDKIPVAVPIMSTMVPAQRVANVPIAMKLAPQPPGSQLHTVVSTMQTGVGGGQTLVVSARSTGTPLTAPLQGTPLMTSQLRGVTPPQQQKSASLRPGQSVLAPRLLSSHTPLTTLRLPSGQKVVLMPMDNVASPVASPIALSVPGKMPPTSSLAAPMTAWASPAFSNKNVAMTQPISVLASQKISQKHNAGQNSQGMPISPSVLAEYEAINADTKSSAKTGNVPKKSSSSSSSSSSKSKSILPMPGNQTISVPTTMAQSCLMQQDGKVYAVPKRVEQLTELSIILLHCFETVYDVKIDQRRIKDIYKTDYVMIFEEPVFSYILKRVNRIRQMVKRVPLKAEIMQHLHKVVEIFVNAKCFEQKVATLWTFYMETRKKTSFELYADAKKIVTWVVVTAKKIFHEKSFAMCFGFFHELFGENRDKSDDFTSSSKVIKVVSDLFVQAVHDFGSCLVESGLKNSSKSKTKKLLTKETCPAENKQQKGQQQGSLSAEKLEDTDESSQESLKELLLEQGTSGEDPQKSEPDQSVIDEVNRILNRSGDPSKTANSDPKTDGLNVKEISVTSTSAVKQRSRSEELDDAVDGNAIPLGVLSSVEPTTRSHDASQKSDISNSLAEEEKSSEDDRLPIASDNEVTENTTKEEPKENNESGKEPLTPSCAKSGQEKSSSVESTAVDARARLSALTPPPGTSESSSPTNVETCTDLPDLPVKVDDATDMHNEDGKISPKEENQSKSGESDSSEGEQSSQTDKPSAADSDAKEEKERKLRKEMLSLPALDETVSDDVNWPSYDMRSKSTHRKGKRKGRKELRARQEARAKREGQVDESASSDSGAKKYRGFYIENNPDFRSRDDSHRAKRYSIRDMILNHPDPKVVADTLNQVPPSPPTPPPAEEEHVDIDEEQNEGATSGTAASRLRVTATDNNPSTTRIKKKRKQGLETRSTEPPQFTEELLCVESKHTRDYDNKLLVAQEKQKWNRPALGDEEKQEVIERKSLALHCVRERHRRLELANSLCELANLCCPFGVLQYTTDGKLRTPKSEVIQYSILTIHRLHKEYNQLKQIEQEQQQKRDKLIRKVKAIKTRLRNQFAGVTKDETTGATTVCEEPD